MENQKSKRSMLEIGAHIKEVSSEVNAESIEEMIDILLNSEKIFVVGAGRSGLVAKMFAMRLMHLGLDVFVVGETITPALDEEDTVVAISGSGETSSTIEIAKITKEENASLIGITSLGESTLTNLADSTVMIRDVFSDSIINQRSIAPLGTLFELTSTVLLDSIISEMMDIMGKTEEDLMEKHATLE